MCGIVGILNQSNTSGIDEHLLCAMRDTMVHRGPDGEGVWLSKDRQIGLAHRRLSIIDLSEAATQPMANAEGDIWLTFNGEIYNHEEIRTELAALGYTQWKTDHSDTEVILKAYEHWGIDCVHHFRGMFAFVLWDDRSQELWLVRDRLGIKPLYWAQVEGRFYFASEIKAIIEDPAVPRRIDEEAAFHYLTFMTTPAPMTMFEGIRKLPAGYRMRVTPNGEIKEESWWDLFDGVEKNYKRTEDEWAEVIREELETSVRYRAVSDVPVGVFLSGGIDSSTNAAMFNQISMEESIKTFTIGYENSESYSNEHVYARQMSKLVGSEHHELDLNVQDLLDFMPRLVYHQDEPIADPVCIPVYYVSELAKKHGITVAQVGEGADEIFWGYPLWKYSLMMQKLDRWPVPRVAKRGGLSFLNAAGKGDSLYYEWLRRGANDERIFWSGALVFTETAKARILSKRMSQKFAGRSSYEIISQLYERYSMNAPELSDLDWMTYSDLRLRLPELLLMRVDKMSMATSLEGRVPFLDHHFVQLALSIPEHIKTKNNTLKYILKKAVRGLIPDELIDRKKQGFGVPVSEWMMKELNTHVRTSVSEFCDATDLIDKAEAMRLVDSGNPNAWYLFNLALWWERFIK
jgi:asparagine synthase (glutamine-hydrolysing)